MRFILMQCWCSENKDRHLVFGLTESLADSLEPEQAMDVVLRHLARAFTDPRAAELSRILAAGRCQRCGSSMDKWEFEVSTTIDFPTPEDAFKWIRSVNEDLSGSGAPQLDWMVLCFDENSDKHNVN